MKWEEARERRGDERLTLFDPRMTRLEVASAVGVMLVFIVATRWSYPGVSPLFGFGAAAVVRLVSVACPPYHSLDAGSISRRGTLLNAGAGDARIVGACRIGTREAVAV
jgi:hypothetical protein